MPATGRRSSILNLQVAVSPRLQLGLKPKLNCLLRSGKRVSGLWLAIGLDLGNWQATALVAAAAAAMTGAANSQLNIQHSTFNTPLPIPILLLDDT